MVLFFNSNSQALDLQLLDYLHFGRVNKPRHAIWICKAITHAIRKMSWAWLLQDAFYCTQGFFWDGVSSCKSCTTNGTASSTSPDSYGGYGSTWLAACSPSQNSSTTAGCSGAVATVRHLLHLTRQSQALHCCLLACVVWCYTEYALIDYSRIDTERHLINYWKIHYTNFAVLAPSADFAACMLAYHHICSCFISQVNTTMFYVWRQLCQYGTKHLKETPPMSNAYTRNNDSTSQMQLA